MQMKKSSPTAILLVPLLAALLLLAPRAGAVQCVVQELAPCLPAMTTPAAPTADCCAKMREQQPCICGYLRDPTLKPYLDSPNAPKVATACRVPYPPQC